MIHEELIGWSWLAIGGSGEWQVAQEKRCYCKLFSFKIMMGHLQYIMMCMD